MKDKYVAYIGSYSYTGNARGITVCDVDVEKGLFTKRCEVDVDNSSYLITAPDGRTLYSIADEGVVSFRILENGSISRLNMANIRGMRGCQLSVDPDGKYLYVAGYHDGKATVMHLNPDGSIGSVAAGVFHKGLGSVADRKFRPHVSCVRITPDGNYIMVADLGMDVLKVYRMSDSEGAMLLVDTISCDLESAPRHFIFSADGKYMYLMYEVANIIDVFTYETGPKVPKLERIQRIDSMGKRHSQFTAACAIRFSSDEKYLYCSNAGDDTISVYSRDAATGMLDMLCCLPVSGEYPKDLAVFPDNRHVASINHETGSITFFAVDYEQGLLIMCANPVYVDEPNCCEIVKLPSEA